jgi:hypothetical protein
MKDAAIALDWSDAEDDLEEGSQLLNEYHKQHGITKSGSNRPTFNTRVQPAFHEANKNFFETFCQCCMARNANYSLARKEVSLKQSLIDDVSNCALCRCAASSLFSTMSFTSTAKRLHHTKLPSKNSLSWPSETRLRLVTI